MPRLNTTTFEHYYVLVLFGVRVRFENFGVGYLSYFTQFSRTRQVLSLDVSSTPFDKTHGDSKRTSLTQREQARCSSRRCSSCRCSSCRCSSCRCSSCRARPSVLEVRASMTVHDSTNHQFYCQTVSKINLSAFRK